MWKNWLGSSESGGQLPRSSQPPPPFARPPPLRGQTLPAPRDHSRDSQRQTRPAPATPRSASRQLPIPPSSSTTSLHNSTPPSFDSNVTFTAPKGQTPAPNPPVVASEQPNGASPHLDPEKQSSVPYTSSPLKVSDSPASTTSALPSVPLPPPNVEPPVPDVPPTQPIASFQNHPLETESNPWSSSQPQVPPEQEPPAEVPPEVKAEPVTDAAAPEVEVQAIPPEVEVQATAPVVEVEAVPPSAEVEAVPPAVEPTVIDPVHQTLQVEDVVSEVCRWLGPSDLAHLVRTAKLFRVPAQRELWRNHAKIEALLFALPSATVGRSGHSNSLVFTKPARPSDWAEPRRLAAMIQKLDQPRITHLMNQTIYELISNGPTASTLSALCPQITTLSWTACHPAEIYAARLFTSPSLKSLRITLGETMHSDSDVFDVFLEHVALTSPGLESLEIFSSSHGTLDIAINPTSLSRCSNLRSINLHICLNTVSLLQSLSSLPLLGTLRAHVSSPIFLLRSGDAIFKSLHTLGLTGGRRPLVDLLNKVQAPVLATVDINVDDVTTDANLTSLCRELSQRVAHISKARLSLTHPSSTLDVTPALSYCAAMADEIVIRSHRLTLTTIDSVPAYTTVKRLSLLPAAGWGQALPLPKLLDLLRYFPALKHLEIGIDAAGFRDPSPTPDPHDSELKTLVIHPGPVQSSWPVAFFISSILPSARVIVRPTTDHAAAWGEIARSIPSLQQLIMAERQCKELKQENEQLRARLTKHHGPKDSISSFESVEDCMC